MTLLDSATPEEIAEIRRRKEQEMVTWMLFDDDGILLEIRKEKAKADELAREKEATRKETKQNSPQYKEWLAAHDPEEFLKEIIIASGPSNGRHHDSSQEDWRLWLWRASNDGTMINMLSDRGDFRIDRKSLISNITDISFNWIDQVRGIEGLLVFLRGKRIISCSDSNGRWFLRVIEKPEVKDDELAGREFIRWVTKKKVIATGMTTLDGFVVGDKLRVREGAEVREVITRTENIKVAGFDSDQQVIIQIDDNECFLNSCQSAHELFEILTPHQHKTPD